MGTPDRFFACLVIVAVYTLKGVFISGAVGVKTAVSPEYVTAPAIGAIDGNGPVTVKVVPGKVASAVVSVAGAITSLNVAVIRLLTCTPVSLFAGTVKVTVGAAMPPPPAPKIGLSPPLPHPATKATSSNAINHFSGLVTLSNLF